MNNSKRSKREKREKNRVLIVYEENNIVLYITYFILFWHSGKNDDVESICGVFFFVFIGIEILFTVSLSLLTENRYYNN